MLGLPRTCWSCGAVVDGHTALTPGCPVVEPREGDGSVCFHCAALGIFAGRSLRRPSTAEAAEMLARHPELWLIQQAIAARARMS